MLRPLSAKLLPITEAEKNGLVNREKLLGISGRRRKEQIEIAEKLEIDYPCPSGGCLLTDKEFAKKFKDLLEHKKRITADDIEILKLGRHFRFGKNKIVVGRDENENNKLLTLKQKTDFIFEVPEIGSPITVLQGPKTKEAIEKAAQLTARYSDSKEKETTVKYGSRLNKSLIVSILQSDEINEIRL